MKLIPRQRIWLAIVIAANLALWIIPSDVVEQIARDRHVMLGWYSRAHFSWNVGVLAISLISFYVDWSTGETYKKRWFQVVASLIFLLPVLGVVDYLLRTPVGDHYVKDRVAYHRPADAEFHAVFEDLPEARRTYPGAPAGFGRIDCTLTTDHRGYRNQTALDQYDVVVLGDSFAEGSSVSDEHIWPVHLGQNTGLSIYNLGMSGYDPFHYLESLKENGLALKPRYVVCLLYEGNDFRSAKSDRKRRSPSFSKRLKEYLKRSPIINGLDNLLINTFGPINCAGHVPGAEVLDWLPLIIPDGPNGKPYAFAPKQLRDLYGSREEFALDKHWLNPRRQLAGMNEQCHQAGCRFIVVFAPLKAHVTLPVVADRLEADKVRTFMKLRYKKELPEAATFLANLLERVDAREEVVAEWCRRESIPFLSVTGALREAAVAGTQVYYTYDQHWTPDGHAVVAESVARFLATLEDSAKPAAGE